MVKFKELIDIYNEVRVNVRNKDKIIKFERFKMEYLVYIYNILNTDSYKGGHYYLFLIKDPKVRLIMSESIIDKIINHYVARYILYNKLNKYLINNNVATRKNMGLDYGIKLLKKMIERNKKYEKFYFLKLDIYKYFYSIDHNVLKSLLIDKLDSREYNIICNIIDSTNYSYINSYISKYIDKYPDIIRYEKGKGLALGLMTSQFLGIFYLYKLHHYIVHDLHIKDFIVYMDDYILIHHDKKYLEFVRDKIINILNDIYHLKVNKNKTMIKSSACGISFLGYNFKVINKKTIIRISNSSKKKLKKKVKKIKYQYDNDLISFSSAFTSINVLKTSYKFARMIDIENIINKYWY